MDTIVIGNATYAVSRVFAGTGTVTELIRKRVEQEDSHFLPLTSAGSASYNVNGRNAG